jgi:hypothetical protein
MVSPEKLGRNLVERRYTGLKFGGTKEDYILLKPRMEAVQESFSVCGWVMRIQGISTNRLSYWFDYSYNETNSGLDIHVTDSGHYTFGYNRDRRSLVTDKKGEWRHICVTWSLASRTARLYFDGEFLGSTETYPPGRKIGLDGLVVLGNEYSSSYGPGGFTDSYSFGGELYKANVFSLELTATDVKEMADEGLCSEVEEKYGRRRYLKWEDFLLEQRSGNVTEIDVGCYFEEKNKDEEETKDCGCEDDVDRTYSRWDLLRDEEFFNKTVSVEMVEQLKQSWEILGNSKTICNPISFSIS